LTIVPKQSTISAEMHLLTSRLEAFWGDDVLFERYDHSLVHVMIVLCVRYIDIQTQVVDELMVE
jgi:hypothetical protein